MDRESRKSPSPSITAQELHTIEEAEALALVDQTLGEPATWTSEMVRYRLSSEFQKDWKVEVGQWLATARQFGYLIPLTARLGRAKTHPDQNATQRDPNCPAYKILFQELAQAMVAHYLIRLGWRFVAWELQESENGRTIDKDIVLQPPNGPAVAIQVKAPDQLGRVVNGRVVDGEQNEWVRTAVRKASQQLPLNVAAPSLIAVVGNRHISLASETYVVEPITMGSTVGPEPVRLYADRLGHFAKDWHHVGGVLLLGYVRSIDDFRYACSVLINPWSPSQGRCEALWFPRARVLSLHGQQFLWEPSEPETTYFPNPTELVTTPMP